MRGINTPDWLRHRDGHCGPRGRSSTTNGSTTLHSAGTATEGIETMSCISAMFKTGGYRAMENYLERAKAEHVAAGHPWKDDYVLKQEYSAAVQ
eukprot:304861-Amphidinium_carterae.1